jgi:hypothetical protein
MPGAREDRLHVAGARICRRSRRMARRFSLSISISQRSMLPAGA